MNQYYRFRQQINYQISTIPKKNRPKFQDDYLKLIALAHKENYDEIEIPEN